MVFKNGIMKQIFGSKWMKIKSEEGFKMRNFAVSSPYRVRIINSRRLRWAIHVDTEDEARNVFKVFNR